MNDSPLKRQEAPPSPLSLQPDRKGSGEKESPTTERTGPSLASVSTLANLDDNSDTTKGGDSARSPGTEPPPSALKLEGAEEIPKKAVSKLDTTAGGLGCASLIAGAVMGVALIVITNNYPDPTDLRGILKVAYYFCGTCVLALLPGGVVLMLVSCALVSLKEHRGRVAIKLGAWLQRTGGFILMFGVMALVTALIKIPLRAPRPDDIATKADIQGFAGFLTRAGVWMVIVGFSMWLTGGLIRPRQTEARQAAPGKSEPMGEAGPKTVSEAAEHREKESLKRAI